MDKFDQIQQSLGATPVDKFLNTTGTKATHTLDDVKVYIGIVVDNNLSGALQSLSAHGYPVAANATHPQIAKMLLKIFHRNKTAFMTIMKDIPVDPNANNYTTTSEFAETFKKYLDGLTSGRAEGRIIQNLSQTTTKGKTT